MSVASVGGRAWRRDRARLFREARGATAAAPRRTGVGRDHARRRPRASRRPRIPLAVLAVGVLVALALASLRIEILRLRYRLMEANALEEQLLERRSTLDAEVARLRDPRRLRALAEQRGFVPPARVIHLGSVGRGRGESRP